MDKKIWIVNQLYQDPKYYYTDYREAKKALEEAKYSAAMDGSMNNPFLVELKPGGTA